MQREENNQKLCFSQADTTAKNCKILNSLFAYWSIQQLLFLYKNKLLRVTSHTLHLSEKY